MATLIEQQITKMGLRDEAHVLNKTTELIRLLDLRSVNMPLQVNEYGKIVLCADIASTFLGIAFDKEQALKLSGLNKSNYANNKRMFEKLLGLNKIVGIKDICIQLNLNEVTKKAEELLQLYKTTVGSENNDIDISHPQYAAIAVYQACKLLKKKVPKTKLMPFSNLRPTQWQQLELRWERFIAKQYKESVDNKLRVQNSALAPQQQLEDGKAKGAVKKSNQPEVEDYEKWKQRMLATARSGLKRTHAQLEPTQNENVDILAT